MPFIVYLLAACIFSMTTSEFMVAGMMPSLAADFAVPLPDIGNLVSAFAASVVIGGPVLTVLLRRVARKTVLQILLLVFCVGQVIAATATGYPAMMASRVISGVAQSAFFGTAMALIAGRVGLERMGRASSVVLGGLMLSSVAGLPMATLIDQHVGWRANFWLVAALTFACGLAIGLSTPKDPAPGHEPLRRQLAALAGGPLWAAYASSALIIGAVFAAFTYFTPIFTTLSGFEPVSVPWLFAVYGVATVAGTAITGRFADRHTREVLTAGLVCLSAIFAIFALGAASRSLTLACVLVVGLAGLPMNPAMVTRVLRVADGSALVNAMHMAVINLGLMAGSYLGGMLIDRGLGLTAPLWLGSAIAMAGLASLWPLWRRRAATAA
ncbi:MFS transporter [Paludibacterium paludis]|uniref:MFS transporter n=1 Tax=Paludibacterium paludis TaxID=1225769 RepID=A0A918U992_9NEIS|nr:MFS transporter [Paludibacterium paludis]GGY12556.1 MFS transporter [Paludibacterium paludis]